MPNCPTCGRVVPTIFEHIDVECHNWPDRGESVPLIYRDYDIGPDSMGWGYSFIHKDYDEGDRRHGHEIALEDCYRAIDEMEDE